MTNLGICALWTDIKRNWQRLNLGENSIACNVAANCTATGKIDYCRIRNVENHAMIKASWFPPLCTKDKNDRLLTLYDSVWSTPYALPSTLKRLNRLHFNNETKNTLVFKTQQLLHSIGTPRWAKLIMNFTSQQTRRLSPGANMNVGRVNTISGLKCFICFITDVYFHPFEHVVILNFGSSPGPAVPETLPPTGCAMKLNCPHYPLSWCGPYSECV